MIPKLYLACLLDHYFSRNHILSKSLIVILKVSSNRGIFAWDKNSAAWRSWTVYLATAWWLNRKNFWHDLRWNSTKQRFIVYDQKFFSIFLSFVRPLLTLFGSLLNRLKIFYSNFWLLKKIINLAMFLITGNR